jgi:hypothetical protein
MIGNDPIEYKFIDKTVFFYTSALYIMIVGTIFTLISMILEYFKLNRTNIFMIYFVLSWIVLSGFILPVATSTGGMVDPKYNPTDWTHLAIILIVSLLFATLSLNTFKKYIQIFLSIVVITSIILPIIYIYNVENIDLKNIENNTSLELSNKKNIFVISFDGMSGRDVLDVIRNTDEYTNKLKDFIIFENAVSQSPATDASLIGDIYGIQDYKSKGNSIAKVRETLKKEDLFSKITSNYIKDSFQFGYSGYGIADIKIDSTINELFNKSASFIFFKYPIVRIFGSIGVRIIQKTNSILSLGTYILNTVSSSKFISKLEEQADAGWNKSNILTVSIFDSFISGLSVSNKEFSLRYLHLTFTHFPVSIDENCKYRSDDLEWHNNNQNEKGIRNSDICGIKKFVAFLNKLKELDIYDKSLIIFKSDHGKPTPYFLKSPDNLRINENLMWGYSRYRPTLMIKDFESNNQRPIYKSELVLLNDIAGTLCEKSTIHNECEKFNGVNLLSDNLESNKPYYIYVVKDARDNFRYDTHISIKIPSRKITLIQAMKDSKFIKLSKSKKSQISNLKEGNIIK